MTTLEVSIIREDSYRVVIEWREGRAGYTLDDAKWTQVDRWYDHHAGEFVFFCFLHKCETCDCVAAVRQYRKDALLDTDKKD